MKCEKPRRIFKNLEKTHPLGLLVPCGICIQCRLERRELWVTRLLHESLKWDSAIFLTLTYDDDHVPYLNDNDNSDLNQTLRKKDLQNFFKRLRKNSSGRKIKYFACGDYGGDTGRPHYHAIIFGFSNSKEDREIIKASWAYCQWENLGKGTFGTVNQKSIRYVVSYIERVIKGKWEVEAYGECERPFNIVSQGMGKDYAIQNKETLEENNYVSIQGKKKSVPRYYRKITGILQDVAIRYSEQKEREFVKELTGVFATRDELYMIGTPDEIMKVEDEVSRIQIQRDKNIKDYIEKKSRK